MKDQKNINNPLSNDGKYLKEHPSVDEEDTGKVGAANIKRKHNGKPLKEYL